MKYREKKRIEQQLRQYEAQLEFAWERRNIPEMLRFAKLYEQTKIRLQVDIRR
jgi:hypothetical protein